MDYAPLSLTIFYQLKFTSCPFLSFGDFVSFQRVFGGDFILGL